MQPLFLSSRFRPSLCCRIVLKTILTAGGARSVLNAERKRGRISARPIERHKEAVEEKSRGAGLSSGETAQRRRRSGHGYMLMPKCVAFLLLSYGTCGLQYTGSPCPRTVTGFCRCSAFRIGKIRGHKCIIRNFQFRKFLPVKSNRTVLSGCYRAISPNKK